MRHEAGSATHVTLLQNPGAGTGGLDRDRLVRLLSERGFAVTYGSTKDRNWERLLEEPGDLVLVAGGDGTVGKAAERLVGRGVPLSILPLGTANNIARTLGLTLPPEQAIGGLRQGRMRPFDAGVIRGPWGSRHFLEGAGLGLFARAMCRMDSRDAAAKGEVPEGDAALLRALRYLGKLVDRLQPQHRHIEADGRDRSGEYLLCQVMNIRSVGPNLMLAAGADPGDGLLDLVLAGEDARPALRAYLAARIAGREAELALPVERVRQVRIVAGGEEVQVDDDIERPSDEPGAVGAMLEIGVEPGALTFLLPGDGR